jgi:hypothetical protein
MSFAFHCSSHLWAPLLSNPVVNPWLLAPTVGLKRSSFMRAMTFQSITKFLPGSKWFLGSLEVLTGKFGNLSLQELELGKVTGSGTRRLPPASVWVSLINKARLRHRLGSLGETDTDPAEDKADHPWLSWQAQQIQSTYHHWSLTLSTVMKSTWWNKVVN